MKSFFGKGLLISFTLLFLFSSCSRKENKKPEILIYCGVTMANPIREISNIIEKRENCKITISRGATGDLYNSLKSSQVGDLFLSGLGSFAEKYYKDSLLTNCIEYSYNQPALFVQKGNPKNISADVNNLANDKYTVVIGNPESSSIGMKTKSILDDYGIYEKVFEKSVSLASDSRDINRMMKENRSIDLSMNWIVTSMFSENKSNLDILELPDSIAQKEVLSVHLLRFSKQKKIAKKIMNFIVSREGKTIFAKHGFNVDLQ